LREPDKEVGPGKHGESCDSKDVDDLHMKLSAIQVIVNGGE